MSLYAQYIAEREGKHIIESDKGFATYVFNPDNSVYIQDIFVHPDYRHDHVAAHMADEIVKLSKERGCTRLYGSVVPSANNSTASLKVLFAYGFKLDKSTNDFIVVSKEI